MPRIIPIRDLKDTAKISKMVQESDEPIFITKNGYGEMAIMNMKRYEEIFYKLEFYAKIAAAQQQVREGKVLDAMEELDKIEKEYGLQD